MNVPTFLAALGACAVSVSSQAAPLTISGSAREPVTIVSPSGSQFRDTRESLRRFLTDRGYAVKGDFNKIVRKQNGGPQWVIATQSTYPALRSSAKLPGFAANARDEAFVIDARLGNSAPVVTLLGKSEAGLRAAAARLVCRVANHGDKLTIDAGCEVSDPFTKMRGVIVGNAARRQCPEGSPFKDIDFETWPAEKIRAYPELFRQFGFNCIQISENRGYGSLTGAEFTRARKAVLTLAKASRESHMIVSFDAWGDCPYKEGDSYCWNDPAQHKALVEYIEEMGRVYGPYVDHFNIHIGDPGGCTRNGCDPSYKTSQQITAEYLRVFRKYNPKVMGAMSTWSNAPFWSHSPRPVSLANYREYFTVRNPKFGVPMPDGAKFLDDTFTPREIGIAAHQTYNDDQADMLVAAGRPVDVWAWYIGDMEMCNNLYITMSRVEEAYSRIPDSARDKIRLNTVEITFHGWPQVINSYCAAQLMWNPRRKLADIEREFCVAGFGPANADAVLELYRACENGVLVPIPQPPEFGTAAYNEKLSDALESAQTISIPPGWKPNFAFPVPARKLVDMLIARTRLTLAVSEAKLQVERAKKSGASADEIARIKRSAIESLPNLPIDPIYSQESSIVNQPFKAPTFAEMIAAL